MDSITRYINFYEIIKRKNGGYPFTIFNTYKHNQAETHWRSFMDIDLKNLFLFDGLGIKGFKSFIVNNNQKTINELLYDFKKFDTKPNQKLKLCAIKYFKYISIKICLIQMKKVKF